jgi:N-acetylglucosaminyldiphosphoundecaprenol N-acetyl-beta-D-mannosaminyltransferase
VTAIDDQARTEILGCPVDAVTMAQAVARVEAAVTGRDSIQHVAINAAKLVKYQRDEDLRAAIDGSELATADGQVIVWAARLLGRPLPERVTGIDLMHALLDLARGRAFRVYLLGARADVLARAETAISELYPGIEIAGRHHGYFGPEDEDAVVESIAAATPDLLFVALETPAKEIFLARHRQRLRIPFVMGVGGTFDVLAGERRRAPKWMRSAGLEWLYRLAQDPRRMAGRYVVGNTQFILLVLRELPRARFRGGLTGRAR